MSKGSTPVRTVWSLLFALIIAGEITSCSMIGSSQAWWNKYVDYFTPQAAQSINRFSNPLVICIYRGATQDAGHVLCLGHMLDHKAKLEVLSNGVVPVFPARQGKAISRMFCFSCLRLN